MKSIHRRASFSACWVTASLLGVMLSPAVAQAATVCVTAPYVNSGYAAVGCVDSEQGYTSEGDVQRTADWGLSADVGGEYRGGNWHNQQSVDLSTGVIRSSLLYASGPDDRRDYQLNNYLDIVDGITFSGSGSAVFRMHLTGAFLGTAHPLYGNSMDTGLDLYSQQRGDDVLGRIQLAWLAGEDAVFRPGTTCGWGFGIGRVECEVHRLDAQDIAVTMSVFVDNITDGEHFSFGSSLNLQAYGPRDGGTAFGNTARLSVELSQGLGFVSDSGVLLSAVPGAGAELPLPGTLWLSGLGLLAVVISRKRQT